MKKYLIPVLICLALVVTMPGVALAKGKAPAPPKELTPFEVALTVTSIDDTVVGVNVLPVFDGVGELTGWKVLGREVRGEVSGDLGGTFVVTYNADLDLNQQGTIGGTLMINTKPGTKRGMIFGTFSGITATVGGGIGPTGPFIDVIFVASALHLDGGTGIYRHIAGEGGFATVTPLRLHLNPTNPFHVVEIEGSMAFQGAYVRVPTP